MDLAFGHIKFIRTQEEMLSSELEMYVWSLWETMELGILETLLGLIGI